MKKARPSILIIYTGGTIGMIKNHHTGTLMPFNFDQIEDEVPELRKFGYDLNTYSFEPAIDSSNVSPELWVSLCRLIRDNYNKYDGFVVLHGTDTMAYSASALSFMLENLNKPVIFTGSQLPIGTIRTDGKENLVSSVEIAAASQNNQALVPEVAVFFESKLFRGNRVTKYSADHFNAFHSANYPPLAECGINIKYNYSAIRYPSTPKELVIHDSVDTNVGILKLFPGISNRMVDSVLKTEGLRAVILETFGSGNAPDNSDFIEILSSAIKRGIIILNVSQCLSGSVDMSRYETGNKMLKTGVIGGADITVEAALTKLMFLLGKKHGNDQIEFFLKKSLSGEINI